MELVDLSFRVLWDFVHSLVKKKKRYLLGCVLLLVTGTLTQTDLSNMAIYYLP